MKILYVPFHDPMNIDIGNGMDFCHYHSILDRGLEVKYIGPFSHVPAKWEQLVRRAYQRTGKWYLKHKLSTSWRVSQATNLAVREWKPDIVFTPFLSSLIYYKESVPCVYSIDLSIYGREKSWPLFGWPALMVSMWQEKRVLGKCAKVITNSEWSRKTFIDVYKVPFAKTDVFALPSTLPAESLPKEFDLHSKTLQSPLRLLLVGRDYRRKGIGIAIETTHRLNAAGIPTELTICGMDGQSDQTIKYVGFFKKNDPEQLRQYTDLYRRAHLLIHPALFEPSPIVAGDAAAFGTPTITNEVGGMATSVANGESGIVLPKWSPADAYVETISRLVQNPEEYYSLCQRTRQRYEREFNWNAVGDRYVNIFHQIVEDGQNA